MMIALAAISCAVPTPTATTPTMMPQAVDKIAALTPTAVAAADTPHMEPHNIASLRVVAMTAIDLHPELPGWAYVLVTVVVVMAVALLLLDSLFTMGFLQDWEGTNDEAPPTDAARDIEVAAATLGRRGACAAEPPAAAAPEPPTATAAEPPAPKAKRARILSVDWMRGLVMLLMAWDHLADRVRKGYPSATEMPMGACQTSLAIGDEFFERTPTGLCAPSFVFLAGVSLHMAFSQCGGL